MDLLAGGTWQGTGVLGPEAFDPDPYLALMPAYDLPYGILEMDPRGSHACQGTHRPFNPFPESVDSYCPMSLFFKDRS